MSSIIINKICLLINYYYIFQFNVAISPKKPSTNPNPNTSLAYKFFTGLFKWELSSKYL